MPKLFARSSLPALLILSVPVWWLLGLDQAVWVAVGVLLAVRTVRDSHRPRSLLFLGLAFVGVVVFSGVLAAEGSRWITLAREVVIASVLLAAAVGTGAYVDHRHQLRWLAYGLAAFFAISSAASIGAFLADDALAFRTPIAGLVPDVVASTRLGEVSLTERALGTESAFAGQLLLRPQGLFLFSTSQAVAASVGVPLLLAAAAWFAVWRWMFLAIAGLTTAMLFLTTTRGAIAALLGASAIVGLARLSRSAAARSLLASRRRALLAAGVAVIAVGATVSLAFAPVSQLVAERSLESRTNLYVATIERWTERPIFGWGTEIDAAPAAEPGGDPGKVSDPRDLPPLGSHSHYLGVLFKQGVVGALVFAALIMLMCMHAIRLFRNPGRGTDWIVIGFIASLLAAITESLWLDPATAIIVGLVWGLLVGLSRRAVADRMPSTLQGAQ